MELAVWNNKIESVHLLIDEMHMEPNIRNPNGNWPLNTAIRDNRLEILRSLLSRHPDASSITLLLEFAVSRNKSDAVKILVGEAHINPNIRRQDRFEESPLTTAIRDKRLEILAYLLEHGADPNQRVSTRTCHF